MNKFTFNESGKDASECFSENNDKKRSPKR